MALPQLSEEEIQALTAQAVNYLNSQRDRFTHLAAPLSEDQKGPLRRFFSDEVLDGARIAVLENEAMGNPEFLAELRTRGYEFLFDMNHLNAISLRDVVVFHREVNKRLLFHGLVHFVQQRTLGTERWVELYTRALLRTGLHVTIPIEVHAYEMDGRFALNPAEAFSVEAEVGAWVEAGRYS